MRKWADTLWIMTVGVAAALATLTACSDNASPPVAPEAAAAAATATPDRAAAAGLAARNPPDARPAAAALAVSNFELIGGWRLDVEFAGEGLALVPDSEGFVEEVFAGAHAHTTSVNVYDLRNTPPVAGTLATGYPLLSAVKTWRVTDLFPRWIEPQNLRDMTVTRTANGYLLGGLGRVFYNTAPRPTTQINVREIIGAAAASTLGAASEIAVDLPEQEFSGFIKHADPQRDFGAIGAGAYDSGQGSVGGLSYAVQQADGRWRRVLTPPGFGDTVSPRLPRDPDYSCPEPGWVCIPPVVGVGVWSTERIGGGGVRYGDNVLFIPTLGYGRRTYGQQSYTFGNPAKDRASAYFFRFDAAGELNFVRYERWPFAAAGELVVGVAIGRLRGIDEPVLFVVKSNAWFTGLYRVGSVLQAFKIKGV